MEQRCEPLKHILPLTETERVHRSRQIVNELAVARGFKVEHSHDFSPAKEQIVSKQIPVNYSLREFVFLILMLVGDLVIQGVDHVFEMPGHAFSHPVVQFDDALEAEAIFDGLFVALTEKMERGQHLAGL